MNIARGNIGVLVLFPEFCGLFRAQQFQQSLIDEPWGINTFKFKHISLGHQPVAQVSAFHQERFAIRADNLRPLCGNKPCRLRI